MTGDEVGEKVRTMGRHYFCVVKIGDEAEYRWADAARVSEAGDLSLLGRDLDGGGVVVASYAAGYWQGSYVADPGTGRPAVSVSGNN